MTDRATAYLDANPVEDNNFTTDKEEAMRRGIYWKPLCECGCGKPSEYTLGTHRKGHKTHNVASWECRGRLRERGVTKSTRMHGMVGIRFVSFDKRTGNIIEPED